MDWSEKEFVIFHEGGYAYQRASIGKYIEASFSHKESKEHTQLFQYEAFNISSLHSLLESYISKRIKLPDFVLSDYVYTDDDLLEIQQALKDLHWYYDVHYATVKQVIIDYFGFLLCKNGEKNKDNIKKYQEILHEAFFPKKDGMFSAYKPYSYRPNQPMDFYRRELDDYRDKVNRTLTIESKESLSLFEAAEEERLRPDEKSYLEVFETHSFIKHMLAWTLDITAVHINELPPPERARLFMWVYAWDFMKNWSGFLNQYLVSPKRYLLFDAFLTNDETIQYDINLRRTIDEFHHSPDCVEFHLAPDKVPEHIEFIFKDMVKYVKALPVDTSGETYEINNLRQLLVLEVLHMVNAKTPARIKRCKNCSLYFIVKHLNTDYCDRTIKDNASCATVGPKQAYRRKLENDPLLKIFDRAYKSQHARIKNSPLTKAQFANWSQMARDLLEQARAGELDSAEFEKLLKDKTPINDYTTKP